MFLNCRPSNILSLFKEPLPTSFTFFLRSYYSFMRLNINETLLRQFIELKQNQGLIFNLTQHIALKYYLIAMAEKSEEKLKFQEEVAQIFKAVFMRDVTITTKGLQKIREAMLHNVQDIVKDALMRAIRRQASLNTVQIPDLLYAIQKKGEKYKLKVGKTLVASSGFVDFGQRKYILNYEQQGDDLQNDNQK